MSILSGTPSERLTQSRERMRAALRSAPATESGIPIRNELTAPSTVWWHRLQSIPGADSLVDSLTGWLKQHPLLGVAGMAFTALAKPAARRHPLALVVGSALVGALLVWRGSWRWIVRPTVLAGLLPLLVGKALTHLPTPWWKAMLASLVQPSRRS